LEKLYWIHWSIFALGRLIFCRNQHVCHFDADFDGVFLMKSCSIASGNPAQGYLIGNSGTDHCSHLGPVVPTWFGGTRPRNQTTLLYPWLFEV
jgi:hypothetical protein